MHTSIHYFPALLPQASLAVHQSENEQIIWRCGWISGILTQDSISLTESLDGVRFSYLATSTRKAGTIRRSTKHPTHSDATGPSPFSSWVLWKSDTDKVYCRSSSPRCSKVDGQIQHYVTVTGHLRCLKHEIEAIWFPLWRSIMSSQWNWCPHWHQVQNTLIRHWFITDSPGKKDT